MELCKFIVPSVTLLPRALCVQMAPSFCLNSSEGSGQLPARAAQGVPPPLTPALESREPQRYHQDAQRQFCFTLNEKAHS